MGDTNDQHLIDIAFHRLDKLETSLQRIPQHTPLWSILKEEYEALYYEVAEKDFGKLTKRFTLDRLPDKKKKRKRNDEQVLLPTKPRRKRTPPE